MPAQSATQPTHRSRQYASANPIGATAASPQRRFDLTEVAKTGRLFTVEENPRLCGWGAEIVSIVAEEAFGSLRGPAVRITTPHIPLPSADSLEDLVLPSTDRVAGTIDKAMRA